MRNSTRLLPLIGLAVAGAIVFVAWAAPDDEEPVTLDQVPAAVRAAIEKCAQDGTIKEIERETRHGQTVYEAEVLIDGKTVEFKFDENGKLLGKETEEQEREGAEHAKPKQEYEHEVTEARVPAAALATLKKLAGDAKITEFAEEVEHGHIFYEGSWKTPAGTNVDGLVTAAGDLVEIEERVRADQVPVAVVAAVKDLGGGETHLAFEKKTSIFYEAKFRKDDHFYEVLFTPDGRTVEKEVRKAHGAKAEAGGDEDEDD